MSNAWYYVQGDVNDPVGPLSLADLLAVLARNPGAHEWLIWRAGFEGWQRADEVKEISSVLYEPPPIPTSRPGAPPSQRSSNRIVEYAAHQQASPELPAAPNHLVGIGGWLILMAIMQVMTPIRMIQSIAKSAKAYEGTEVLAKFPMLIVGEMTILVALFGVATFTTILFFRHSPLFPKMFIVEILFAFISTPLVMILSAAIVSIDTGQSMTQLLTASYGAEDFIPMIYTAVMGLIWIPYILNSRRVANTFTKVR